MTTKSLNDSTTAVNWWMSDELTLMKKYFLSKALGMELKLGLKQLKSILEADNKSN